MGCDQSWRQAGASASCPAQSAVSSTTGGTQQTPDEWAAKQIYGNTVTRIQGLQVATATRATAHGSADVPTIDELRPLRRLVFRIDADDAALRTAVTDQLERLRTVFPDWEFDALFGIPAPAVPGRPDLIVATHVPAGEARAVPIILRAPGPRRGRLTVTVLGGGHGDAWEKEVEVLPRRYPVFVSVPVEPGRPASVEGLLPEDAGARSAKVGLRLRGGLC